ncbi:MAG: hypothetical protein HY520_02725 [Candidatus Aenigmarchaeota archaeon]|nr:hypothetical protein [Candidatus Aenigmarchaeota archaeon]
MNTQYAIAAALVFALATTASAATIGPSSLLAGLNLPDLIVDNVSISISGDNTSNSTVNITAVIKNIGNATANASITGFRVVPLGGDKGISTPALAPGASTAVTATYSLPSGAYNLTVKADATLVVAESVENNNVLKTSFSV